MEQRIKNRYSESILDQARTAYGIKEEDTKELDGFESYIYEFSRDDKRGILRISHSIRRTVDLIQAELEWINHLHLGGVRVARPLQTIHGDWLEIINDGVGGCFMAAAFDWAQGQMHRGDWPAHLLREYGSQLGKMHQLAVNYQPVDPSVRRAEWHDPLNLDYEPFIPAEDRKIREISRGVFAHLHSLPTPPEGYGLIHQDAHQGNFHVDQDGKIIFFDFDDCAYGWYVNDIALVLFYASMGQEDIASFVPAFLDEFLAGYYRQFYLDPVWFREIPTFQKLRELDLYALIHRSFDVENLDDPWCMKYMEGRKERLENKIPFLDFDFANLDLSKYR